MCLFRLLGPLEIVHDAAVLPAGPAKQKTLLTALLLEANRVVPLGRLVGAIWDGDPPPSAVANIRTYASRLRKLIHDATGQDLIISRAPGYVVAAGDSLDLAQFQRQAEAGRAALARGDAALATLNFGAALQLWRGAAAEDVERSAGLTARLAALDGQRLTVIEEWVHARQVLPSDPALVADLRRLTAEFPLREKLWAGLMTALYRGGDVAGALDAFAAARQTLAEQLGVDPGTELHQLQRAMLAREDVSPRLDGPVTIAASVPRELPAAVALTGREKELAAVTDDLDSHRIVAIHGAGGTGKSALALAAAHQLASGYPDGQVYLDLHGATGGLPPQPVAAVLNRLLRTLGVPPGDIPASADEASARFRSLAAGRRMVLVYDNAVSEAQVRPLLPGSSSCAVLITSRQLLSGLDRGVHIELGPLSQDAAVALLERLAGADRAAAEPGEVERMAGLCDRLPLALRIAGARLSARPHQPIASLNSQLDDEQSRLDILAFRDLAIRACLEVSLRELAPAGGRLFRLLGLLRVQELAPFTAAALADVDTQTATGLLDELTAARLLEQTGPARYRLHDLVRLYATELAAAGESTGERARALHRVLATYVAAVRRAGDLLRPGVRRAGEDEYHDAAQRITFGTTEQALAWLAAERTSLLTLARQTSADPAHRRFTSLLLIAMYGYLSTQSYWDDLGELADLAAGVAVSTGDVHVETTAMVCQATVLRHQHRLPEALDCLHRAMQLREQTGDERGIAGVLSHLGLAHAQAGELGHALSYLEQSVERHVRLKMAVGEGIARNDAADVLCRLGRTSEARTHLIESLRIRRTAGDRIGEAITLAGLGKVAVLQGEPATAIVVLTGAGGMCQSAGVPVYEWLSVLWRALAHWQTADPAQAMADIHEASRLCSARRDHRAAMCTDAVRARLGREDTAAIAVFLAAYSTTG